MCNNVKIKTNLFNAIQVRNIEHFVVDYKVPKFGKCFSLAGFRITGHIHFCPITSTIGSVIAIVNGLGEK